MLSIAEQIEQGRLVCPLTRQRLRAVGAELVTEDGARRYPYRNGVPILLPAAQQAAYLGEVGGQMAAEYAQHPGRLRAAVNALLAYDYRSAASRAAFAATVEQQPDDALCLSIGGGPNHVHPKLVNLNISLFANVHVVGDAYQLPYADGAVDAIYCEAVLEHLELPNAAVREMARVLRPGGQLFAATPFMQKFHAYPNHFQNYTLIGHRRLFERAGLTVRSDGVCVGPTFAIFGLLARYMALYVPIPVVRQLLTALFAALALALRPLDRWVNRAPDAHILASTTYVHAVRPAADASPTAHAATAVG